MLDEFHFFQDEEVEYEEGVDENLDEFFEEDAEYDDWDEGFEFEDDAVEEQEEQDKLLH